MIVNYDRNCSFMVLDTVITIVNYDHHMFIVQATEIQAFDDRKIFCIEQLSTLLWMSLFLNQLFIVGGKTGTLTLKEHFVECVT